MVDAHFAGHVDFVAFSEEFLGVGSPFEVFSDEVAVGVVGVGFAPVEVTNGGAVAVPVNDKVVGV